MDHSRRRRVMDAEGGRAVHRARRARMLTVVSALQYLLVIACLLVTFYVYWSCNRDAQMLPPFEDDVHIGFVAIAVSGYTSHSPEKPDKQDNILLKFVDILSSNRMAKNDDFKISVNCTGPYVLYMDVCCKSMRENKSRGTLELLVARSETPVSSLTLNASTLACRGLHSIAYLRKNDEVSVQLTHPSSFKLLNVTGGLHYLLGSHCEY